jgi:hypothetical protein
MIIDIIKLSCSTIIAAGVYAYLILFEFTVLEKKPIFDVENKLVPAFVVMLIGFFFSSVPF